MEFIIIGIISIIAIIVLKYVFDYNKNQFKKIVEDKEFDELSKAYKSNI